MADLRVPRDYKLRAATAADAVAIARHRVEMFRDMGILDAAEEAPLSAASRLHLENALRTGEYRGWVMQRDGEIVAGAGLVIRELLPRPGYPRRSDEAYVLNVYTEPAHRRQGLARRLMQHILTWSADRGFSRVSLHASDDGRRLYEGLGLRATNEMRVELPGAL